MNTISSHELAVIMNCSHSVLLDRTRKTLSNEIDDGSISTEVLSNGNVKQYVISKDDAKLLVYRWCKGTVRETIEELSYKILQGNTLSILELRDDEDITFFSEGFMLSERGEEFLRNTLRAGPFNCNLLCRIMNVTPMFFHGFLSEYGSTFDDLGIDPFRDE